MLTKEEKQERFEILRADLAQVHSLFILENHGLKVNDVNELRSKVRSVDATYRVVKNSVVRLAVEGTGMEGLSEHLSGPNAFAFTEGDAVQLAKVLRDFAKDHPALTFKQAFMEGQVLGADDARKIADLPSREELVSRLLFLLQSPMRRLAVVLNGPVQQLVNALHQVADTKES